MTRSALEDLQGQIGDAFDRHVDRRRRRRRVARRVLVAAAVAVVVAGGLLVAGSDQPAAAGVEVTRRDGRIYVELTDIEYRPAVIEDATSDAGLSVVVKALPVGPSLVGRFLRFDEEGHSGLERLDVDGSSFTGFTLLEGWDGRLTVYVGRPARDDEPYKSLSNALSEGEPLACTGIVGLEAGDALDRLKDVDVDIRWRALTATTEVELSEEDLSTVEWARLRVSHALAPDARNVIVYLASEDPFSVDLQLTRPADC